MTKIYYEALTKEHSRPPSNVAELFARDLESVEKQKIITEILTETNNKGELEVGTTIIHYGHRIHCFHGLIVHKNFRQKGIGTRFVKNTMERYKGIWIVHCRYSKKFWKKIGFTVVNNNIAVMVNDKDVFRLGKW